MKKILFPTDFSATSLNAFRYALHLADKINAEIITLHVYDLPIETYADYSSFLPDNYNITDWEEFENCKSDVPKLRKIAEEEDLTRITMTHMLHRGRVVDTIIRISRQENIDFIVMGTTGATGLGVVFLGSVTEDVLSKSSTNVLAVPQHCFYRPIKSFLFLSRFKNYQKSVLVELHELAIVFNAQIHVLHVKNRYDGNEAELISEWRKDFPTLDVDFHIKADNDVEGTILDFIQTEKIDIVAMPVHHKSFLKKLFAVSLSQKLTFHCNVPIMGLCQG